LRFNPRRVLLLGHGENSIYEIASELNFDFKSDRLVPIIGDIRDERKLRTVVEEFRPGIFFHAAAHKHVPLMELHPDEALKNNVTGTLNVARAADAIGAKKFILISSDKAVRPTNVMGASKRVAEMIVFCMARTSRTQFVAVRFGNVLGSRGSVIPLFKRQIARGGPVTVTHADVTRFFMTIPEAVSLVIQAGSKQEQRRLFLLDMGAPVRIADLARNLIRLSGFDPDKEIKVLFTGLRPGEKLTEELLTAGENVKATDIGKIFVTQPDEVDCAKLWESVAVLRQLAEQGDGVAIRKKLRELIPDYTG
jgi:FlaA1/EpsC-like NDP-sugar epimerase